MSTLGCRRKWRISEIAAPERWALNGGPFGSKLVSSMYVPVGVPVVRGCNLPHDKHFDETEFAFVSKEKADELRQHVARPGDIVITQRGTLGQVGFIPTASRFPHYIISQSQMKLTVDRSKADPLYIYYVFRAPSTVRRIQDLALTTGVPHINLAILRAFEVELPLLPEQQRVASILSAYDALIDVNRRRIALLRQMTRRLFEEWFVKLRFPGDQQVDRISGLPAGWRRVPIKAAYEGLFDGPHATPPPADQGPVFLSIGNVTETGHLDLASVRHIADADFASWTKRVVPKEGDIVFTYEATLNRYALIPKGFRGCLGRRLALIRADSTVGLNRYLYLYFFTEAWREVITKNTLSGATVDRIPLSRFPDFPITLPPDDLLGRFDGLARPMFEQMHALNLSNTKLKASFDLLLPRLVSGELHVVETERELEAAA